MKQEIAVFGGGCFWCTEAIYQRIEGVLSVLPGYAGGNTLNPTYEHVSEGTTNHAEVIQITFDPSKVSYKDLLDIFWHTHDPTTINQQGADVGTQYRSIILTTSDTQQREAETLKQELNNKEFQGNIATEVKPLDTFYPAEKYHKDYFNKHEDAPYCQIVIAPKLEKLKKLFSLNQNQNSAKH